MINYVNQMHKYLPSIRSKKDYLNVKKIILDSVHEVYLPFQPNGATDPHDFHISKGGWLTASTEIFV